MSDVERTETKPDIEKAEANIARHIAKKKPPLGSGARFKKLSKEVGSDALAAYIGRKKYGKQKFQKMAAKGRKRA